MVKKTTFDRIVDTTYRGNSKSKVIIMFNKRDGAQSMDMLEEVSHLRMDKSLEDSLKRKCQEQRNHEIFPKRAI